MTSSAVAPRRSASAASNTLSGPLLRLVQAAAIGLTLLSVGLAIAGIPYRVGELTTLCELESCPPDGLSYERAAALESLHITPRGYVTYFEALAMGVVALCLVAGGILFARRPNQVIAIVTAYFVIQVAVTVTYNIDALARANSAFQFTRDALAATATISALLVFFLFPDGRFVPRWMRWPALVWIAVALLHNVVLVNLFGIRLWSVVGNDLAQFVLFALAMGAQVYRYRRISTPAQRQQTRWILVVIAFQIAIYGILTVAMQGTGLPRNQGVPGVLYAIVAYHVYSLTFLLIPASFYFSILRYRLWDLTFYINRTLIYGAALVALAGAYFGAEYVVFGILHGFDLPISDPLVASLAALIVSIVALPVYNRIKAQVGQRFPRERFNPLKTPYMTALAESASAAGGQWKEFEHQQVKHELDEALRQTLDGVLSLLPCDAANVMLVQGGQARVHLSHGYIDRGLFNVTPGMQFPIADTVSLSRMARTLEPLLISSVRQSRGWQGTPWLRSYLGVPIALGDHLLGFLNADSLHEDAFTPQHIDQMNILASYAATVISNARLMDTSQRMAAKLIQLEQRNIELDSFSQMVAHDLRGPIHIISGFADLLVSQYADQMDPDVRSIVDYIQESIQRMDSIIENLLLLASTENIAEHMEPVDMDPVTIQALKRVQLRVEKRGILIEVGPDLPPVMGQDIWLEEVLVNLIENAIKYIGDDNTSPHIAVRGTVDHDRVWYEVEDNGLGIPQEMQKDLFQPFQRFHPRVASGSGLGLSIARRIVEKMGGEITAESEPGKGSTFRFYLPAVDGSTPAVAPETASEDRE